MSVQSRTVAEAFPPGDFLREELEARDWTQADLAEILGVSPRLVNEIVNAKRSITPETAKVLGDAFGTDPQYWMNLESAYQLWRLRPSTDADAVARRAKLFSKAPVKEMLRRNWIEPSANVDLLEKRVLDFFKIKTLEDEPEIWARAAARKSTPYVSFTPAQCAWLVRAKQLAKGVHAASFNGTALAKSLPTLRGFFSEPEEIRHVPPLLAQIGIRFLIVQHLEHTRIDGACLWLDRRSPVIVLSLRYDRIDAFWHTLLHELGHVKQRDGLDQYEPLDVELLEPGTLKEKPKEETKADGFATDFLVPQGDLEDFITRCRPLYSTNKILGFAALHKIHPGIVVGQLQHRGEVSYAHSRQLLVKVRHIVTQSTLTDGWGHSVPAGL